MARRDRKCYLCGTNYKYCSTCSQDRVKPSWMAEFHSEDCVRIFDICTRFNMELMSKAEAKEALDSCDLSNKDSFKSYVQKDIANIYAEEPKKRGQRAKLGVYDEAITIDDTHEVVTTENE